MPGWACGRRLKRRGSEKKAADKRAVVARVAWGHIRTRYLTLNLKLFVLCDANSLWQCKSSVKSSAYTEVLYECVCVCVWRSRKKDLIPYLSRNVRILQLRKWIQGTRETEVTKDCKWDFSEIFCRQLDFPQDIAEKSKINHIYFGKEISSKHSATWKLPIALLPPW